jgi:hypothetical protein
MSVMPSGRTCAPRNKELFNGDFSKTASTLRFAFDLLQA